MAWVGSTVGFQPEMVPSSVAKIKRLGPEVVPFVTTKSAVPLKTWPVGLAVVPGGLPAGGGMVTTSAWLMLQRNLLYTAVTRAKRIVVLVGSRRALAKAVRTPGAGHRHTALTERLRTGRMILTAERERA